MLLWFCIESAQTGWVRARLFACRGMDAFSILTQLSVSGGHLKKPVVIPQTQTVAGTVFFKLTKADQSVTRMLVKVMKYGTRPLANTDVIEQLVAQRDAKCRAWQEVSEASAEGKEDLGLDDSQRRRKKRRVELPPTAVIVAPTIGDAAGTEMIVLAHQPGTALWVELTGRSIGYLVEAVDHQLTQGTIKRNHPGSRVEETSRVSCTDIAGLSYSYARKAFRATAKSADNKPATRYFREEDEAVVWLQSQSSSPSQPLPLTM